MYCTKTKTNCIIEILVPERILELTIFCMKNVSETRTTFQQKISNEKHLNLFGAVAYPPRMLSLVARG